MPMFWDWFCESGNANRRLCCLESCLSVCPLLRAVEEPWSGAQLNKLILILAVWVTQVFAGARSSCKAAAHGANVLQRLCGHGQHPSQNNCSFIAFDSQLPFSWLAKHARKIDRYFKRHSQSLCQLFLEFYVPKGIWIYIWKPV